MADPQSYRPSNLPSDPGVYRFFDINDKVIYVGKAKNIKNRLNSYFGNNLQIEREELDSESTKFTVTKVNQ
jgi:excinuclease ABC subunit C